MDIDPLATLLKTLMTVFGPTAGSGVMLVVALRWFALRDAKRDVEASDRERRCTERYDELSEKYQVYLAEHAKTMTAALSGNTQAMRDLTETLRARGDISGTHPTHPAKGS